MDDIFVFNSISCVGQSHWRLQSKLWGTCAPVLNKPDRHVHWPRRLLPSGESR